MPAPGPASPRTPLRRLGLLGGTFDPVHCGHLTIATQVATAARLDQVWFIPAHHSPLKSSKPAAAVHRLAMLQLALQDYPHCAVSTVDLARPPPSYTTDTVQAIRELVGEAPKLFLIAGADVLLDLQHWRDPERLLGLCHLLIAWRPGFPRQLPRDLAAFPGIHHRLTIVPVSPTAISSSEIRARIRHGRSLRSLVPPAVAAYIRQHHLYAPTRDLEMRRVDPPEATADGPRSARPAPRESGERAKRC